MQSVQMENPKVFPSILIVWIAMANCLNFNIFMFLIMTTKREMFNKPFLVKSTSPFPVEFNIRFVLIKLMNMSINKLRINCYNQLES